MLYKAICGCKETCGYRGEGGGGRGEGLKKRGGLNKFLASERGGLNRGLTVYYDVVLLRGYSFAALR